MTLRSRKKVQPAIQALNTMPNLRDALTYGFAKQMPYADENGEYPASIWVPDLAIMQGGYKTLNFAFHGWPDVASYLDESVSPSFVWEYYVYPDAYDSFMGQMVGPLPFAAVVVQLAWIHATTTADILSDPNDANSPPVSFFANAGDVSTN